MNMWFRWLGRELNSLARQRAFFLLRAAIPIWLLVWFLPFLSSVPHPDNVLWLDKVNGMMADRHAMIGLVINVGLVVLIPLLSINALQRERSQGTLPLLMLARLGPLQIVTGKLLARLLVLLVFLAAIWPFSLLYLRVTTLSVTLLATEWLGIMLLCLTAMSVNLLIGVVARGWMLSMVAGMVSVIVIQWVIVSADGAWLLLSIGALVVSGLAVVVTTWVLPRRLNSQRRSWWSRLRGWWSRCRWSRHLIRRRSLARLDPYRWLLLRQQVLLNRFFLYLWTALALIALGTYLAGVDDAARIIYRTMILTMLALAAFLGSQAWTLDRQQNTLPLLLTVPSSRERVLRSNLYGPMVFLCVAGMVLLASMCVILIREGTVHEFVFLTALMLAIITCFLVSFLMGMFIRRSTISLIVSLFLMCGLLVYRDILLDGNIWELCLILLLPCIILWAVILVVGPRWVRC